VLQTQDLGIRVAVDGGVWRHAVRFVRLSVAAMTAFTIDGADAQVAHAQACDGARVRVVARHEKIPDLADKLVVSWCRPWPHRKGVILAAIAYDDGIPQRKSLVVVTIDQRRNRVLATHRESLIDDALRGELNESTLRLDTAAYRLDDTTFAFGLRRSESLRISCGDGTRTHETLTLLVPQRDRLRPVVTMATALDRSLEGCLPSAPGRWESAEVSIAMGKSRMNGYADLLVTATISPRVAGASEPREVPYAERAIYRYSGDRYRVHRYDGAGSGNPGVGDEAWWLR
jgi:hypothetical protein